MQKLRLLTVIGIVGVVFSGCEGPASGENTSQVEVRSAALETEPLQFEERPTLIFDPFEFDGYPNDQLIKDAFNLQLDGVNVAAYSDIVEQLKQDREAVYSRLKERYLEIDPEAVEYIPARTRVLGLISHLDEPTAAELFKVVITAPLPEEMYNLEQIDHEFSNVEEEVVLRTFAVGALSRLVSRGLVPVEELEESFILQPDHGVRYVIAWNLVFVGVSRKDVQTLAEAHDAQFILEMFERPAPRIGYDQSLELEHLPEEDQDEETPDTSYPAPEAQR